MRIICSGLCVVALAACGGGGDTASCKVPATVTLAGTAIPNLTHGLAFEEDGGYRMYVFNHDKRTCDDLRKGMYEPVEGEQDVIVSTGRLSGVSFDASTKMGEGVATSVATRPAKDGDPVAICASARFKLMVGPDKDKELAVDGKFEGRFCGKK